MADEIVLKPIIDISQIQAALQSLNEELDQLGTARANAAAAGAEIGIAETNNITAALGKAEQLRSVLAEAGKGGAGLGLETELRSANEQLAQYESRLKALREQAARPVETSLAGTAASGPGGTISASDLNANEKAAKTIVTDLRGRVKAQYKAEAADMYDELVRQDVLPINTLATGKTGAGNSPAYVYGESARELNPSVANDTRFFAPGSAGKTPEDVINHLASLRGESFVGPDASRAFDEVIQKLQTIKELEAQGRPAVDTGFNENKNPDAANQIARLLENEHGVTTDQSYALGRTIAYGGDPNKTARQIVDELRPALATPAIPQGIVPGRDFYAEPTDLERAQARAEAAVAAAAQQTTTARQPELVPATQPASTSTESFTKVTEREQALVFALNKKIEALDAQTKATNEATRAERLLATAADKAATAKSDQADTYQKAAHPTKGGSNDSTAAAEERTAKAAATEADAEEKSAKEAEDKLAARTALRTALKNTKGTVDSGINTPVPLNAAPGSAEERAADLYKGRTEDARAAAIAQEALSGDEGYIKSVAKLRILYERTSASISEELNQTDAYAKEVARGKINQQLLNTRIQEEIAGSANNSAYVSALAQAKVLHQQEAAAVQQQLTGSRAYAEALAQEANARREQAVALKSAKLQGVGLENSDQLTAGVSGDATIEQRRAAALRNLQFQESGNRAEESYQKAQQNLADTQARIALAKQQSADGVQTEVQLNAQSQALTKQLIAEQKRLVAEQARADYNALPPGDPQRGSFFQRVQSGIASRAGNFRAPTEFQDAGQFLQSRFLTTAGFAVSGVATYAAFAGLQKMLTDGVALEKVMQQVRAEFTALGDANFDTFRSGIISISQKTGEAAQNVAQLALQFKGAFGAKLNDTQILQQVQSAVELSRVTGISIKDIQNSLTGVAVSFGTNVEHIGDVLLTLQDRTGVSAAEMVKGLAAVAVEAQNVGLTVEQTSAIIAVSSKYTGQSADTVAEGLNRIFPNIQAKAGQIIQLFEQADPSKLGQVTGAFETGNLGGVLDALGQDYNKLNGSQQQYLDQLVGGARNAKILTDVLSHYGEVQQDINAAQDSGGRLAKSYADLQQTLAQQISKVVTGLKDIGAVLLQIGGSAVLQAMAKAVGAIVSTFAGVLNIISSINSALHGTVGILAEVLLGLKAISILGDIAGGVNGAGIAGSIPVVGGRAEKVATRNVTPKENLPLGGAFGNATNLTKEAETEGAAVTGFSDKIRAKVADSASVIKGGGNLLANALDGFEAVFATAGPLIAVFLAIQTVTDAIATYNKTKATYQAVAAQIVNQNVPGTSTAGPLGPGPAQLTPEQQAAQLHSKDTSFDLGRLATHGVGEVFHQTARVIGGLGEKTPDQLDSDNQQKIASIKEAQALQTISPQDLAQALGGQAGVSGLSRDAQGQLANLQKIAQNGITDDKQYKTFSQTFLNAIQNSKTLQAAYKKIVDGDDQLTQLQGQVTAGLQDLPQLQIQQQTGQISNSDFLARTTDLVNQTQQLLLGAIAKNAAPDYINTLKQQFDQAQQARDQVVTQMQKSLQSQYVDAASIASGGNQQSIAQAQIKADIAALQVPNALADPTTVASSTQIAQQLIKAQQDQIAYEAQHATDLGKVNAILLGPQKITPYALTALNASALENLPDLLESNLKDVAKQLRPDLSFDQFIQLLATAKGGVKKAVQDQIDQLERIVKTLNPHTADYVNDVNRIGALHAIISSGLLDVGSTTNGAGSVSADTGQQIQDAKDAVRKALVAQNPVASAQEAVREANRNIGQDNQNLSAARKGLLSAEVESGPNAQQDITNAKALVQNGIDKLNNDKAAWITANQQLSSAQDAVIAARGQLLLAEAGSDPVKQAAAQINIGYQQLAAAKDDASRYAALATIVSGQFAAQQAQSDILTAQANVAQAQANASGTPIQAAQAAVQAANVQAANAQGKAAQLNALAAQINAQKQLQDALNALAQAQGNTIVALLTAAGDTVGAAKQTLKNYQDTHNRYLQHHQGSNINNDPNAAQLFQKVIADQASARDALLQKQEGDIQFELDVNKISTGQAITRLQNLLATANITETERQDLERKIYQLKQQITKDLQFNLPTDLKLPTLYEARRLTQDQQSGIGYQDNRQVTINVNGSGLNQQQLTSAMTDAVNAPPRSGVRTRLY